MLICHEKQFIFIHIPKNSGTEMSKEIKTIYCNSELMSLVERDGPNLGIDKMHLYNSVISKFISNEILHKYVKFCIVRNPYNKMYSAWNFIKESHGYDNVNDFIKYKVNIDFIYGLEIIPGDARVHYRPQFTFVYDDNENKCVDFIIKYENLNNDIKLLNNKFNLNIPEYGNNKNIDYLKFYNQESINKINILYKKDFELFNYDIIEKII